jgi:hypothetical protein
MDRRSFLRSMIGGVAAATAVRTFPFRVFSFPSEIEIPKLLLSPGDVVTFGGVFQVNPVTRKEVPILKNFVITDAVFSGRRMPKRLPIFPVALTEGPYKNCAMPKDFTPDMEHLAMLTTCNPLTPEEFKMIYPKAATLIT